MTIRTTAFQRRAFQFNAFQQAPAGPLGSGDMSFYWAMRAALDADREKRKREKAKAQQEQQALAFALEHVTAQAAPIVTDLAATLAPRPRYTTLRVRTRPDPRVEAAALAEFRELLDMLADMDAVC